MGAGLPPRCTAPQKTARAACLYPFFNRLISFTSRNRESHGISSRAWIRPRRQPGPPVFNRRLHGCRIPSRIAQPPPAGLHRAGVCRSASPRSAPTFPLGPCPPCALSSLYRRPNCRSRKSIAAADDQSRLNPSPVLVHRRGPAAPGCDMYRSRPPLRQCSPATLACDVYRSRYAIGRSNRSTIGRSATPR